MKKLLLSFSFIVLISSLSLAQTPCNAPVITEVKGGGTYCPKVEVTLEVVGTLNNATAWTWYSGSCGGQTVGTGTSIKVKVDKTTTYYVRGTGGCVGATATCTSVVVKYDDVGPTITNCPADLVVPNETGKCGATVTFTPPTGTDACSDKVEVKRVAGLDPGSFFPVGVTEVKYELTDTIGNVSTCSFNVTVEDKENPVITCVANIEQDNDPGECGAIVTYAAPTYSDNCPGAVMKQTAGLGSGSFFPVGVTTETYTVTDAAGNVSTCSFTITVNDVELPVITLKEREITSLWPANHKHQEIAIEDYIESVSDNCGGITIEDVIIDEIGSDEANNGKGDGNTTDDIVIADDCHTTKLLAERSGNGNGRVYVVTLAVKDLHDNIGFAEFIVEVPHDKGKKNSTVRDSIIYIENGCDLLPEEQEEEEVSESASSSTTESSRISQPVSVYPNPFTGSFSVNFTAKANDRVKVELYNMLGMKVTDLLEQNVEANTTYSWTFEKPTLNSNDYVLIIRGSKTQQVVRLVQKR
jgi:hypothetical protein